MAVYISRNSKVTLYCTGAELENAIESILDRTDVAKGITPEGYIVSLKVVSSDYDDRIAANAIDKFSRIKSIVNSDVPVQEDVLRYKMIVDILNQEDM